MRRISAPVNRKCNAALEFIIQKHLRSISGHDRFLSQLLAPTYPVIQK